MTFNLILVSDNLNMNILFLGCSCRAIEACNTTVGSDNLCMRKYIVKVTFIKRLVSDNLIRKLIKRTFHLLEVALDFIYVEPKLRKPLYFICRYF